MRSPISRRSGPAFIFRRSAPSNFTSPPVTRTVRGRMPRIAFADRRLAGAAFADQTARFAACDLERDIAQDRRAVAFGDRAQVREGENRLAHRRITGSSERRRPSPSRLNASTVRNSADQRRRQHPPALMQKLPPLGDHSAPGRHVGRDGEPDEGEDRLDDDRDAHLEADQRNQDRQHVGKDLADQDAHRREADRARGRDIVAASPDPSSRRARRGRSASSR